MFKGIVLATATLLLVVTIHSMLCCQPIPLYCIHGKSETLCKVCSQFYKNNKNLSQKNGLKTIVHEILKENSTKSNFELVSFAGHMNFGTLDEN